MPKRPHLLDGLARVNRFPPDRCRLYSCTGRGKGVRPKTNLEISQIAGLPVWRVRQIAKLKDWNGVTIEEFFRFTHGCGISPLRRDTWPKKDSKMIFIDNAGPVHLRMFDRVLPKSADLNHDASLSRAGVTGR